MMSCLGYRPGDPLTPEIIDQLVAGHYLRNSRRWDWRERRESRRARADRYAVLGGTIEILGSSLFGLTFSMRPLP